MNTPLGNLTDRVFRAARPAAPAWVAAKTLGQMAVVWSFAHWLLPSAADALDRRLGIDRRPTRAQRRAGAALFAAGSALGAGSAATMALVGKGTPVPFDAARELVVAGPYRFVRNPMAISAVLQSCGVAIARGSTVAWLIPVGEATIWSILLGPAEERYLAEQFGQEYEAYRSRTRNWRPTFVRRSPDGCP